MASFQKRGKTWQYTISHKVGDKYKPIRKGGFKTKKEAQVAAAEVEAQLRKGLVPVLTAVPFAEYFETWIDLYKKDVAKNTLERYLTSLKTVREYFGDKPIQQITKAEYQVFLNEYGETHAKESSRKLNTHIRACVKEALDEGLIRVDFTRNVTLTGTVGKRPEEKHLNFEESERLLKELHKRLDKGLVYYLLLLGLTSGMRFGEMVGLTRKDFDFKNNIININKQWGYTKRMPKGFGPTKNEQSVRKIKMDPKTMKLFKELFDKTPDNVLRLVFYSPTSKYNCISNTYANNVLRELLKELKIDPITVHGLRHTHASILLYKRVSIYYISERLGHKDVETTMRYYSHVILELREEDEKQTTNIFGKMLV